MSLKTAMFSSGIALFALSALSSDVLSPLPKPQSVADYKAPEGRSAEMQSFDKAVLYLSAIQENDGHWDAAKSGATSPEFSGINADITVTALAANVLLSTARGKQQNPDAMMRGKRAIQWLTAHLHDGRVADESANSPIVAQVFAAMNFLQAASLSTRETMRNAATASIRYALIKMRAQTGGFSTVPNAPETRMDMTALGTLLFTSANVDGIKYEDTKTAGKTKSEAEIETALKAGTKLLMCDAEKKGNTFCEKRASESDPAQADWDATIGGLVVQTVLLVPTSQLKPGLQLIFGPSGSTAELKKHLSWGNGGDGFRSLSLWMGTIMVVYNFSDNMPEQKEWFSSAEDILLKHQSADGSWEVAGYDAKYGKIWRTALNALTLLPLEPAPPPAPPVQDPTAPPPPGK